VFIFVDAPETLNLPLKWEDRLLMETPIHNVPLFASTYGLVLIVCWDNAVFMRETPLT